MGGGLMKKFKCPYCGLTATIPHNCPITHHIDDRNLMQLLRSRSAEITLIDKDMRNVGTGHIGNW
jgi:hypothetical protein